MDCNCSKCRKMKNLYNEQIKAQQEKVEERREVEERFHKQIKKQIQDDDICVRHLDEFSNY